MGDITRWVIGLLSAASVIILLGVTEYVHADQISQKHIFMACAQQSEMTFYAAQEKLYNNGSVQKLLALMHEQMAPTLYRLTEKQFVVIGRWVDAHDYPTAKDYAAGAMFQCLDAAFKQYDLKSDDQTAAYLQRYQDILDSAEEKLLPYEVDQGSES